MWLADRDRRYQEYQLANRLLVFAPNGQVYFSCRQAVYSEEVVTGAGLEVDAAMLQGAEMIKTRPDQNRLWSTYRRAVEAYAARKLSHQADVIDAFSGILSTLSNARCVEGIPVPLLNIALLWQPQERLHRRDGFASWSWTGWVGKVHWLGEETLDVFQEVEKSELDALVAWNKVNGWIVWYSSLGTNCKSAAFRVDGPPWLHGTSPEKVLQDERFPDQPQHYAPTADLLPDRLASFPHSPSSVRYLQFWTMSLRFDIALDTTAVMRYSSLGPDNTGNGLRRFILHNSECHECGWVLLDEGWIERVVNKSAGAQEFILLSEAQCDSGELQAENSRSGGRQYNAMMIGLRHDMYERTGLGRVMVSAQTCMEMMWKEILLG
jgi:hypothetical protein